jgi:hypothetical protein
MQVLFVLLEDGVMQDDSGSVVNDNLLRCDPGLTLECNEDSCVVKVGEVE